MKLTIIKEDNAVIVDGERHTVDCSDLPADFHALQWDGAYGEIEYTAARCVHCGARSKKGNASIAGLELYQKYVNEWAVAKAIADTARIEAEKQADAAGPQG